MTEDVIGDTITTENETPEKIYDADEQRVIIRTANGREVAVKIEDLLDRLHQVRYQGFTLLEHFTSDQLAAMNLPGSKPAKDQLTAFVYQVEQYRDYIKNMAPQSATVNNKKGTELDAEIENIKKRIKLI